MAIKSRSNGQKTHGIQLLAAPKYPPVVKIVMHIP
jgi:hypothetical protein